MFLDLNVNYKYNVHVPLKHKLTKTTKAWHFPNTTQQTGNFQYTKY